MRNFLENFNFSNKNIFVIGGSGLIGSSVIKNFENLKGKVFNLDIKKSKNDNAKFIKFDCTKLNGIENLLTDILKTMGIQTSLLIVATHTTKTGQNAHLKY